MYRVSIELQKHEWKFGRTRNAVGTRAAPQLFRVLPNFHECFYNSIETRSTCFLFLLENTATRKNIWLTLVIKIKILFAHAITTPTACASSVSPSIFNTHDFWPISTRLFLGLFLKLFKSYLWQESDTRHKLLQT